MSMRSIVQMSLTHDTGRAHHVKYPGGKAEQQENDEPPWRNPQPAVEQPADDRPHNHTCDQFGRKSKTAGIRRSACGLTRIRACFGMPARCGEPVAETLEPRGESGFVVRRFVAFALILRAVSHASTRSDLRPHSSTAALKAARTILTRFS